MSIATLPARTPAAVHPWAPRFAQAITGVLCLEAVIFQTKPVVVFAAVLIALALIGPRWSPVAWLFSLLPVRPAELEPSRPVRFAQWMAIGMLAGKQPRRRGIDRVERPGFTIAPRLAMRSPGPWHLPRHRAIPSSGPHRRSRHRALDLDGGAA